MVQLTTLENTKGKTVHLVKRFKQVLDLRDYMMRSKVPWFLFIVTVLLSAWFGLRMLTLPSSGGAGAPSPDGRYYAEASSLKNYELSRERRIYAKFVIRKGSSSGPVVTSIQVLPERVPSEWSFREDEFLKIEWSKDSTQVVFTTPNEKLILHVPTD